MTRDKASVDLRLHRDPRQTTLRPRHVAGAVDAVAPPQTAWPDDGEIDIMEHVGFDPGVVHGTMHTEAYNHTRNNSRTATTNIPDVCTAFHKYQLTWNANQIKVGVDDRNYYQYSNDGSGNAEWPFDSPQYLIFNIAVGGDWGGQMGVDDTIFPIADGSGLRAGVPAVID